MNRLLVLGVAAAAALMLLHRPPAPAAAIVPAAIARPPVAQHFRKGHPFAAASAGSVVYVAGAVRRPGLYTVAADARVNDAIARAGGFTVLADDAAVNLAQRVTDGEEIRVPRTGEILPAAARSRGASRKRRSAPPAPVDLNAADAAALASLPGLGATLAQRIVEYRAANGPFGSLDELADVSGMTQRRIDAISPYLTINSTQ